MEHDGPVAHHHSRFQRERERIGSLAKVFATIGLFAVVISIIPVTKALGGKFAGHDFDAALLAELPAGVDPCGENGEFHTCVYDGPMFSGPIAVARGETVLHDGRFAYTDFTLLRQREP